MSSGRLFWSFIGWRKGLAAALLGCAVVVAAAELAIPWLIKLAVDAALEEEGPQHLDRLGLAMLGIVVILYVSHVALLRIEARLLAGALFRLRQRLYSHFHAQSLAFFHRHKVGELLHRATNDVSVFGDHATELASDLPFDLLTVAGVLGLMLWLDPRLTALVAAFLAASSLVSWRIGRPLPTIRRSLQQIGARLSARLQEGLAGARTVRAFGNQRREIELLDTENQEMRRLELSGERLEAWIVPVFDLMEILGIIVVAWYGGHLILAKRLTPGGLVAFIAYMEILAGPVSRISRYYRHLQGCRAVGARLVESLADRDELPAGRGLIPAGAAASVVLEHVSFRYPGAERDALVDVSFEVEPGQVVAVVGRNGAGKSTLIDVILRLHDPTAGHVLLGGLDLRDWDDDRRRAWMGVMPQEVFLFHSSVAENIAYGRPGASRADIEEAARAAGLEPILNRLPKGLDEVIGDRGARLSGGERQRLALARLFLRDPALLVLDEPTAHLDGEASGHVGEALRGLMKERTTFIVAHRVETVQLADRVLLLDQGRLVDDGAPGDLEASHPLYRALLSEMRRTGGGGARPAKRAGGSA